MDVLFPIRPRAAPVLDAAREGVGAPAAASLRFRLRDETRDLHEALDAGFERLGSGDGTRGDYARFLLANEACHRGLEPFVEASGLSARLPPLAGGSRRAAAQADLDALALRPIALPPFPLDRPRLPDGFGVAYVLEGSRLGARVILARLRDGRRLETGRAIPTSFLEAAGRSDRFRRLMAAAEGLFPAQPDRDGAVAAARAAFDYFLAGVRLAAAAANGDGG